MRELDSLLLDFFDRCGAAFTDQEMTAFEGVLELPDPVLHSYLLGRSAPDDHAIAAIIERIRAGARSEA
jgi:succinate dehydrogenase flavin-adding protein (antitoxin of CptAB toxin-antitoxin module)